MIAAHVTVILVPLALDLLLWLGPRLRMERLAQPALPDLGTLAASAGLKAEDIHQALQAFNLLGILRTFPIGIPSLMSGVMPTQTPWGSPAVLQISSAAQLLALTALLTLGGWVFGGLYFRWVAALATPGAPAKDRTSGGRAVLQTVAYALVWSLVGWIVGLPVIVLLYVVSAINALLGQGLLLLIGFMSMWLVVPIFFSPHGMYVRKQNAFASILGGFQLTRFTLPTSSLFVLTVFLLGVGLNLLWGRAPDNSWLVLVGIFGHAFVTTALLASSFVYYHNMTEWLQMALARLRTGLPGQQA